MTLFASRLKQIVPSASMRQGSLVAALKAKGADIADFTVGQPDFNTPAHIIEAAYAAANAGNTKYTESRGILPLREAISRDLARKGVKCDPKSEVLVTPGCKQAIFYAAMALLEEGDEVLIPEPAWLSYKDIVLLAGGKPVPVPSTEDRHFKPSCEDIEEKATGRTRMLFLNNPNNPTGMLWSREELGKIAGLAKQRDFVVMSDEGYDDIAFDGKKAESIMSLEGMRERTILVDGFSKSHAMTGWRIGFAAAPEPLLSAMFTVHQHVATCASSISQHAALAACSGPDACVREMAAEYQRRRDYVFGRINSIGGLSCLKPEGGFYAFVNVRQLGSSQEAAKRFLDNGVALVPGDAYGACGEGYLRLSFATGMATLEKGLDRMEKTAREWK